MSEALSDAVAASRSLPEGPAFDHELKTYGKQEYKYAGDGIVCGVSGWFTRPTTCDTARLPPIGGTKRRRNGRRCSGPHLRRAITVGNRNRELAIDNFFEAPGLAHLIALTRRAVRDRQVLSPDILDDVQFAALAAAWVDARAGYPHDDLSR